MTTLRTGTRSAPAQPEGSRPSQHGRRTTAEPTPRDEEEALEVVEGAEPVGIPSVLGLLAGLGSAITQPGPLTRGIGRLGRDLAGIAWGTDDHLPSPKDKRFADPAWTLNPVYRRIGQAYTAFGAQFSRLVDEYEEQAGDWYDVERARFAVGALTSALAPTNTLPGNPAALKRAFDTAGLSLARSLRQFVRDVRTNGGLPAQTDRSAFTVGESLAVTTGAVVDRDEVAELIEYRSSTRTIHGRPLLIVPPPIGRYYFLDLRPGRSFVEYAASRGLRVFLIS